VDSQDLTLRKKDSLNKDGYGRISALMVCSVRSKVVVVIIMAILFIPFTIRVQSSCFGPWFDAVFGGKQVSANRGKLRAGSLLSWRWYYYAKGPHGRISTALRGKLSKALEFRIGRFSSPSQAYSVRLYRSLAQSFCPPVVVSGYSVPSPSLLIMVRQSGRNHSGGRRGSGKRSLASHSVDPEQSLVNIPSSHVNVPPPSPVRKPTPNSAFQTTHFKFQSNLNRPLITAHITIILSEEENQLYPLSCMVPEPSQSSEQLTDGGSQENRMSDKLGQDEVPIVIQPLEDNIPTAGEGIFGATNHTLANLVGEKDGSEDLRIGSACEVAEKTPGEDVEV